MALYKQIFVRIDDVITSLTVIMDDMGNVLLQLFKEGEVKKFQFFNTKTSVTDMPACRTCQIKAKMWKRIVGRF